MKPQIFAGVLLAATFTLPALATAMPLAGSHYLPQARVSPARALAAAVKKEAGTIVAQELEKEPGGSGLRYSFDVKVKGVTHEVGIDASTGAVVEDSIDNGND